MPPIIIAALRTKMVALAGEIGQGVVFANAARSHMAASLAALPAAKRDDPGVLHRQHAADLHQRRCRGGEGGVPRNLIHYAFLPNYRNYWKEAGYVEEMTAIERAIAEGRRDDVPNYLTRPVAGGRHAVRPGQRGCARAWRHGSAAGVRTPVIVPSSTPGGQLKALEEIFATFG